MQSQSEESPLVALAILFARLCVDVTVTISLSTRIRLLNDRPCVQFFIASCFIERYCSEVRALFAR